MKKIILIIALLFPASVIMARSAEDYLKLGSKYYNGYALPLAENCFKKALELDSTMTEAKQNLGIVYYAEGKDLKALQLFKEALGDTIYIDRARIFLFIGIIYILPHDSLLVPDYISIAIRQFDSAMWIKPDFSEAYYWKAKALELIPDMEKAIKFYRAAIEVNPQYAQAYNQLGVLLYRDDDFSEAEENFLRAIHCGLDNSYYNGIFYYNLSIAYLKQGRKYESDRAFQEAKRFNPTINTSMIECLEVK